MFHLRDKGHLKNKNWRELCEAASREHNPEKLLELITALNNVLEQKEKVEKANRSRTMAREELPSRRNGNMSPRNPVPSTTSHLESSV